MRKLYVLPIMLVIFSLILSACAAPAAPAAPQVVKETVVVEQKVEVVQTLGCGEVGRGGRDRDAGTAETR